MTLINGGLNAGTDRVGGRMKWGGGSYCLMEFYWETCDEYDFMKTPSLMWVWLFFFLPRLPSPPADSAVLKGRGFN